MTINCKGLVVYLKKELSINCIIKPMGSVHYLYIENSEFVDLMQTLKRTEWDFTDVDTSPLTSDEFLISNSHLFDPSFFSKITKNIKNFLYKIF